MVKRYRIVDDLFDPKQKEVYVENSADDDDRTALAFCVIAPPFMTILLFGLAAANYEAAFTRVLGFWLFPTLFLAIVASIVIGYLFRGRVIGRLWQASLVLCVTRATANESRGLRLFED